MSDWQQYWKGILGFLVPGAVIIGSSVTSGSDGGSTITGSEWVTAVVAMIVTGAAVTAKANAVEGPTVTNPPMPQPEGDTPPMYPDKPSSG